MKFALPLASALTLMAWGAIEYRGGYERAGSMVPSTRCDSVGHRLDHESSCVRARGVMRKWAIRDRITRSGGHPKP